MRKWLVRALLGALAWFAGVAAWIAIGPTENPNTTADAAIILGAAAYGDKPSPVFRERIAHGIDLYRQGRVRYLLFTGGTRDPAQLSEAAVARKMAIEAGVPAGAILIEEKSHTTRQNLTYARQLMGTKGIGSAIIVSDPLHLRRAMAMAGDLDMQAQPSATPTTRYRGWSAKTGFLLSETWFMHRCWLFGE